jgi:nitronate monooxygenase
MLSTELTRTFGLKHPIVSAPMANWSGGELAGAVSAGGGLGMIGVGSATPEAWIAEQANLARPHGPFGTRRSALNLRPSPSTPATRRPT